MLGLQPVVGWAYVFSVVFIVVGVILGIMQVNRKG